MPFLTPNTITSTFACMQVTSAPYPMWSRASLVVSRTLKGSSIPARKQAENLADALTRIDIFALQKTIEFSLKRLARFYSRFLAGAKEPFTVISQVLLPIPSLLLSHMRASLVPTSLLQGQGQRTSCGWMLTNLKTSSTRPANTSGRWRRSRRRRQWRRSTLQTSTSTFSQKWRPTWRWAGQWVGGGMLREWLNC